MTETNERRTTFVFSPPEDNALAWHTTLDGFQSALSEAYPGAFTRRLTSVLHGDEMIEFEVEIAKGIYIEGVASTPVEECGVITLMGVTAGEAAVFVRWLRDSYIPSPELLTFNSEFVLESGNHSSWTLPTTGGIAEIESALRDHLATAAYE